MDAIKKVLEYEPPPPPSTSYLSPEALVFETREGKWVSYKGFKDANGQHIPFDHERCLIATEWAQKVICRLTDHDVQAQVQLRQKQFKEIRELEVEAKNWAFLDMTFRTSVVAMILGGQFLHYVGIDAPLIGGPLSTARWGLLIACTFIHPIAVPLALLHTLVTGGRFIGPTGLLTRGLFFLLVTELVRYYMCRRAQDCFRQAFDLPSEKEHSTRNNFVQDYQKLWHAIRTDLENELDKASQENRDLPDKVVKNAKGLLAKEADLRRIYGFNASGMRNELGVICWRICNYANSPIARQKLQAICESMAQYPLTLEGQKTKLLSSPLSAVEGTREFLVLKEVNKLLDQDNLRQAKAVVRSKGSELIKAICPRLIKSKSDRPPEENPVDDINWIRKLHHQLLDNAKESSDPILLQELAKVEPLVVAFEKAVQGYEALTPLPEDIKKAIVIATLMAEQDDDTRFGRQQQSAILKLAKEKRWENPERIELLQYKISDAKAFNEWVNGISKKLLEELKVGLLSGSELIQWVDTLAPGQQAPDRHAPGPREDRQFEEVNLDRYTFWDQYRRFKPANIKTN